MQHNLGPTTIKCPKKEVKIVHRKNIAEISIRRIENDYSYHIYIYFLG